MKLRKNQSKKQSTYHKQGPPFFLANNHCHDNILIESTTSPTVTIFEAKIRSFIAFQMDHITACQTSKISFTPVWKEAHKSSRRVVETSYYVSMFEANSLLKIYSKVKKKQQGPNDCVGNTTSQRSDVKILPRVLN